MTGISLDKQSVCLYPGDAFTVGYTVKPASAENKAVTFYSSDINVATVDADGTVRAAADGECLVLVTSVSNTSVYTFVTVKVSSEPTDHVRGSGTTFSPDYLDWILYEDGLLVINGVNPNPIG